MGRREERPVRGDRGGASSFCFFSSGRFDKHALAPEDALSLLVSPAGVGPLRLLQKVSRFSSGRCWRREQVPAVCRRVRVCGDVCHSFIYNIIYKRWGVFSYMCCVCKCRCGSVCVWRSVARSGQCEGVLALETDRSHFKTKLLVALPKV